MTFKQAVEATEEVKNSYQPGLQALEKDHCSKIITANTRLLEGSLDIDNAVKALYPQSFRWDYAICFRGEVYFVEVHGAVTSEVNTVIRKALWLRNWLQEKAPAIKQLKADSAYLWIQTSRSDIRGNKANQLAESGIKVVKNLSLL